MRVVSLGVQVWKTGGRLVGRVGRKQNMRYVFSYCNEFSKNGPLIVHLFSSVDILGRCRCWWSLLVVMVVVLFPLVFLSSIYTRGFEV